MDRFIYFVKALCPFWWFWPSVALIWGIPEIQDQLNAGLGLEISVMNFGTAFYVGLFFMVGALLLKQIQILVPKLKIEFNPDEDYFIQSGDFRGDGYEEHLYRIRVGRARNLDVNDVEVLITNLEPNGSSLLRGGPKPLHITDDNPSTDKTNDNKPERPWRTSFDLKSGPGTFIDVVAIPMNKDVYKVPPIRITDTVSNCMRGIDWKQYKIDIVVRGKGTEAIYGYFEIVQNYDFGLIFQARAKK